MAVRRRSREVGMPQGNGMPAGVLYGCLLVPARQPRFRAGFWRQLPLGLATQTEGSSRITRNMRKYAKRSGRRQSSSWRAVSFWNCRSGCFRRRTDLSYDITKRKFRVLSLPPRVPRSPFRRCSQPERLLKLGAELRLAGLRCGRGRPDRPERRAAWTRRADREFPLRGAGR